MHFFLLLAVVVNKRNTSIPFRRESGKIYPTITPQTTVVHRAHQGSSLDGCPFGHARVASRGAKYLTIISNYGIYLLMHKIEFQRRDPDLAEVVDLLRSVHAREYPEGAPQLYERLMPRLPDFIRALVRRKLDLLIAEESDGTMLSHAKLSDGDKQAMAMFFDQQVLRAHYDVGRDSTLSNDDHSIAHIDTLPPIVAHNLIEVAAGNLSPDRLRRMGAVFFDVDGTKTIVDCTSHAHAGRYLEAIAKFLCKPPATVGAWLMEKGLQSEAYSYAGDEFIVVLRAEDGVVDAGLLDEYGRVVQAAMAADEGLNGHISFDNTEFVMEYAEWTDQQRAAYLADPSAMEAEFAAARALLPDVFIPSVSFGSATFEQGLLEALSPDTKEARTLEELGINATRLMVSGADDKLKHDKQAFRASIQDPRWKAFLLRNAENRRLERELDEVKLQLKAEQEIVQVVRKDIDALLAQAHVYLGQNDAVPPAFAQLLDDGAEVLRLSPEERATERRLFEMRGKLIGWYEAVKAAQAA